MSKTKRSKSLIKPSNYTEVCGWYGMIALIVAYALVSFAIIHAEGIVFQALNITGSIGLMIVAASKNVFQSVILNIFWVTIGIIAIIRILT